MDGTSLQFKTDSSITDDNYPFRPSIAVPINVNFAITAYSDLLKIIIELITTNTANYS